MTSTEITEYLRHIASLNPRDQALKILRTRKQFLQQNTDIPEPEEETVARERLLKQIEQIREQFWSLDRRDLEQQLEALDVSAFPDLAVSVTRLKRVASHKRSFQRLKQNPICFPEFYQQFCSLVIAPSRTAGQLRTQYLEEIRHPAKDSKTPSLRIYRQLVKKIELEYPDLKALERFWLNQITQRPKPKKMSSETLEKLFVGSTFCLAASIAAGFLFLALSL